MSAPSKPGAKGPRGELAELTAGLQNLCTAASRTDKELRAQKRDVFKKIINYLTVGMDMSSLFPSMTSCANLSPDDVVLKKMLYLYITHYAAQAPDLALLTINQLHKDCVDSDPLVRGLALRSLCSLRLANFLEYVSSPVLTGLSDKHPYVRRTAVMGVLKIWHVDRTVVTNTGMLEGVQHLLHTDSDPQVLSNCLTVLGQIQGTGGLLDKVLLYGLLNRLKEFSEWSQCVVLDLVAQYTPRGEPEVYELLNALEERLGSANSGVVLAACKAFLHLTLQLPATHQQVLERIKEPLKSVIGRDDPGATYAVLAHVLLLTQRAPIIFENDYPTFYCRTHDPWYIKKLKMEILSGVATSTNVYDIVNELTEYARDVVHPAMAREAVRAVGRIALAVPDVAGIVERLLIFLESGCDAVVSEALVVMKDLLRRCPDMAEVVVAQVMGAVTQGASLLSSALTEPAARASLLWIVGQFGQYIPEGPYLLEGLVDGFTGEEEGVKLALLTAAAQLFFKRPPECRALLGALLAAGLADSNQDVHDRSLLYYRLLRTHVAEAERIINPPLAAVMAFSESLTPDMKDTIFKEFNTLSVVYQLPADSFLDAGTGTYHTLEVPPTPTVGTAATAGGDLLVDNATNLLADVGDVGGGAGGVQGGSELDLLDLTDTPASTATAAGDRAGSPGPFAGLDIPPPPLQPAAVSVPPGGPLADLFPPSPTAGLGAPANGGALHGMPAPGGGGGGLLDLDDMLGGLGSLGASAAPPAPPAPTAQLDLDPQARLAPRVFQDKWRSLPVVTTHVEPLNDATITAMAANGHKDVCAHFTQAYIHTTASGGSPPTFKYYFYGVTKGTGSVCLAEMIVSTPDRRASVTFKSELPAPVARQFADLFTACLAGFVR